MLFNSQGLVVNAYHDAEGRQNYFPGSSGTSEGQFAMVTGCLTAYLVTGDQLGKDLGELALSGILNTLYRNAPVPDQVKEKEIFAPHWLFNVKYPFTSTNIELYTRFNFVNGVATIPDPQGLVRYTFHIRSSNSVLLWDNPYSSLSAGSFYNIRDTEFIEGVGVRVRSTSNLNGLFYVAYSQRTGPVIQPNQSFEAWPDWRALDRGEIDCAVDTLVWAEHAYNLAYQVFGNPVWSAAARATREQAVQAFDVNDSRDWIKPSWSDDPFSVGSSFGFSNRLPAPVYARDSLGRIVITAGRGNGEVQYGNASRLDTYRAQDRTVITIGSGKPIEVQIYIDKFQNFALKDRYVTTLKLAGTGMQTFTLRVGDFRSLANDAPLTAGSPVYTVGVITRAVQAHEVTVERIRQLPPLNVLYYPGAIPFTANFLGSPAQLIDWRGPIYAGYQSPDMWLTIGNAAAAATCVRLLYDAQTAFVQTTGGTMRGPFAPVFYFRRADAVQYGDPDTFGWEGPDPNTKWGGYQYRPLVELSKATWRLTGSALNLALDCIYSFHSFLADDTVWVPGEAAPSDYPADAPLGQALYKEPHFAALIMRSIIYLDQKLRPLGNASGEMRADDVLVLAKCYALLKSMWHTSGPMKGTFSGQPEIHEWYGFHHAEILTTLSLAIEWGEGPAQQPEIAADARVWVRDMLRWARANVYVDPSPFGTVAWTPAPDWVSGIEETFSFQTQITTAFNGKEQRLALRERPRRSMKMRHTLASSESQAYDDLLRRYQNRPVLIPQWHLSNQLAVDALAGTVDLTVDSTVSELLDWGGYVVLSYQGRTETLQVENHEGTSIAMVSPLKSSWPAGTAVVVTMRGTVGSDISASRRTSAVTEAEATFDMLPQEDRRRLPVTAAPFTFTVGDDTREVVLLRHNWAESASVRDAWEYDRVAYAEGPVQIVDREINGHRTLRASWTFFDLDQINAYLAMLHRLRGRQVACWLPSGMLDFVISRETLGDERVFVYPSALASEKMATDSAVALMIRLTDGRLICARVVGVAVQPNGEYLLGLDRTIPVIRPDQVAMINIMHRVRATSDDATIVWLTGNKAEATMSFTTVFDET